MTDLGSIVIFILLNVFAHPYWIKSYFDTYGKDAQKDNTCMLKR